MTPTKGYEGDPVMVRAGAMSLEGDLVMPDGARGIVVFVHGSGSSRFSPRNRLVAGVIREAGLATLLFDLLTGHEEELDRESGQFRFDIRLLAERAVDATQWVRENPGTSNLKLGLFGSSTGSAAALVAAARRPEEVSAVVSRGGRPDLAAQILGHVAAPTLFVVGGDDTSVLELNRDAIERLGSAAKKLEVVEGAGHLFEEPRALEQVAALARDWFEAHLHAVDDS